MTEKLQKSCRLLQTFFISNENNNLFNSSLALQIILLEI